MHGQPNDSARVVPVKVDAGSLVTEVEVRPQRYKGREVDDRVLLQKP
ncbi:MAG: hypothetical protein ACI9F9_003209 [Candidatus Paceibacteria bacterium]|jgi:hypothetical protein